MLFHALKGLNAERERSSDRSMKRRFVGKKLHLNEFWASSFSFLAVYLWFVYDWRWFWFDLMIPYGVLPCYVHILICWYGIHEYSRLLCTFRAFAIILNGQLTMQECWPLFALHLVHRSTLDAYAVGQSSCPMQREAVKPLWYIGHFSPSTSPSTRMSTST